MLYISQLAFTILTAPIPSNELEIYTTYNKQLNLRIQDQFVCDVTSSSYNASELQVKSLTVSPLLKKWLVSHVNVTAVPGGTVSGVPATSPVACSIGYTHATAVSDK